MYVTLTHSCNPIVCNTIDGMIYPCSVVLTRTTYLVLNYLTLLVIITDLIALLDNKTAPLSLEKNINKNINVIFFCLEF